LRQHGCRILLRGFGRNLDAFEQMPHEQIDFIQLAPDLTANVHSSLMDEMLVSIIHGQAQRLNIAVVAGPVDLPVALATLTSIGIDGVWGSAVKGCEPLNALLENSFFAIK
ncbi:MAG: EAL domain-containing protein, partial [Mixta sp.]